MAQLRGSETELAFLAHAGHSDLPSERRGTLLDHQLTTSPLVTLSALEQHATAFPSRALLGTASGERIYLNTNAPSSGVICGVQGAGKSHTVSCILESALIPDERIGQLPKPLAALVCHFNEEGTGGPCEAAYLSQPSGDHALAGNALPKITVLCSPSNISRRRRDYAPLSNVEVHPLYLAEQDLTASRMLAIMGCDNLESMPLYLHSALMIIRSMGSDSFSYSEFRRRIRQEELNPMQRMMINLRLDLLDAYLRPDSTELKSYFGAGQMVLVDLTDPFLDGITAGILFDIALGSFMQWETDTGKLFVLDEAHKVLTSNDAARLTRSIAGIIRQQRHLATRVVIATQEPTVIPRTILDLASFVMCHRFSSPAWCKHLAGHVSAGSDKWLEDVMMLETGDALLFSAASLVGAQGAEGSTKLLGQECLRVRVRPRLTSDGGASVMVIQTPPQHASIPDTLPLTPTDSPSKSSAFGLRTHDSALPTRSASINHTAPRPASFDTTSLLTLAARLAHPLEIGMSSSLVPEFSYSPSRPSSPLSPPASEYSTPVLQHAALPPFIALALSASDLDSSLTEPASKPTPIMPLADSPSPPPTPPVLHAELVIHEPSEPVVPVSTSPTSTSRSLSPRFDVVGAATHEQETKDVSQVARSHEAEHIEPAPIEDGTPSTIPLEAEKQELEPEDEHSLSDGKVPASDEEKPALQEQEVVSEDKGAISISGEPEGTVDSMSVPPIDSARTELPPTEASILAIPTQDSAVELTLSSSPPAEPARALSAPPLLTVTATATSAPAAPVLAPATESPSVVPQPTSSPRFDALISFLRKQHAQDVPRVPWSTVGQHVRTRLGENGSQLPVQAFLREAAREKLVLVSGQGSTGVVSLLPTASESKVSSPTNLPAPLASAPTSAVNLAFTTASASGPTPIVRLDSVPTPLSHSSKSLTLPATPPPAPPAPMTTSSISAPQTPSSRFNSLQSPQSPQHELPAREVHRVAWLPDPEHLTPRMAASSAPPVFYTEPEVVEPGSEDEDEDSVTDEDSMSEEDSETLASDEESPEEDSEESASEEDETASDEEATPFIRSDPEDEADWMEDPGRRNALASVDCSVPPTPVDGSATGFAPNSTPGTGLARELSTARNPLLLPGTPTLPAPVVTSSTTTSPASSPLSHPTSSTRSSLLASAPVDSVVVVSPVIAASGSVRSMAPSSVPSPLVPARFQSFVSFLEQKRSEGVNRVPVIRVPWSTIQIGDTQGAAGTQHGRENFLADAVRAGVIIAEAAANPSWVALPPSPSRRNSAVVTAKSAPPPAVAPVHKPTHRTSTPTAPAVSSSPNTTANFPARFRTLVDVLRQQHDSGVAQVSFSHIGERVKQRISTANVQVGVKAFVEDAQRAGIVTYGGSGNGQWVALKSVQTVTATPITARVRVASTSSLTTRSSATTTVPERFTRLVNALQTRRQKGEEMVPWTTLSGGLQQFRFSGKDWVGAYMNDAAKAGVIQVGGTKGKEWAKLIIADRFVFV